MITMFPAALYILEEDEEDTSDYPDLDEMLEAGRNDADDQADYVDLMLEIGLD